MRALVACLLAGALGCAPGRQVELALQVPAGQRPLDGADAVTLSVLDASGRVLAFRRAPAQAAELAVSQLPDGRGLTLALEAWLGADVVALGRSCPFDLGPDTTTVPLYFSRAGAFAPTGAPSVARAGAAVFAQAGGVVLAGGTDAANLAPMPGASPSLDSTERYDPATGAFSPGPKLLEARAGAAVAALSSETALLFGGAQPGSTSVEALSPQKSLPVPSFSPPDLVEAAAARLGDGRALVSGGRRADEAPSLLFWLTDAAGTTVELGPSLPHARAGHTATLTGAEAHALVLFAGGFGTADASTLVAELDLYDPTANAFLPASALLTPRRGHSATRLADGRILLAGGRRADGSLVAEAELFDPATRSTRPAGTLVTPRARHTALLLPSGHVLLAGGEDAAGAPLAAAELFDPTLGDSGDFVPTSPLDAASAGLSSVQLCDGTVLLVGGTPGAERYTPFP